MTQAFLPSDICCIWPVGGTKRPEQGEREVLSLSFSLPGCGFGSGCVCSSNESQSSCWASPPSSHSNPVTCSIPSLGLTVITISHYCSLVPHHPLGISSFTLSASISNTAASSNPFQFKTVSTSSVSTGILKDSTGQMFQEMKLKYEKWWKKKNFNYIPVKQHKLGRG